MTWVCAGGLWGREMTISKGCLILARESGQPWRELEAGGPGAVLHINGLELEAEVCCLKLAAPSFPFIQEEAGLGTHGSPAPG